MKIIGHRGAKGLAAENTLASIKKALALGVDEIEIDLRVTSDGKVVLIHDKDLERIANNKAEIAETTYVDIKKLKSDIATFDEALDLIDRQKRIMVEVKPDVDIKPIVAIFKQRLSNGWKNEDFMLGSFSQKTLMALHHALPDIEKVVIAHWSGVRAGYRARQLNCRRINMSQKVLWSGYIRAVARGGYELCAYPLNDTKKAARWAKYGLYGAITDYPDRYKGQA